jgi:hypothetical protein
MNTEPRYLGGYGFMKGSRVLAFLFGLLLVGAQLLNASLPASVAQSTHSCCRCGGKMSCCRAPSSSQPAPVIPSNTGPQKQFSIYAPAIMAVAPPQSRAALICPAARSSAIAAGAPLYTRDCARLI